MVENRSHPEVPRLFESVTKLNLQVVQGEIQCSGRNTAQGEKYRKTAAAVPFVSPARQRWDVGSGTNRVRFSGRDEFRNTLFLQRVKQQPQRQKNLAQRVSPGSGGISSYDGEEVISIHCPRK